MLLLNEDEQNPTMLNNSTSKYTSILQSNEYIFLGRDDGEVEIFNETSKGKCKIFEKTFDPLENEDIEKHINAMAYLDNGEISGTLFSGNDRHLKAIRVRNDTSTKKICDEEYSPSLRFTTLKACQNVHTYALSSISINMSKEYLITSDYIKVNLWNPHTFGNFYNIIDIKNQLLSGLVFVINVSKFSPFSDNIFGYSTSNGNLIMNDTTITPRSEPVLKLSLQNVEGIRSISDFSFLDENFIATRTMNNVSVFDLRNPGKVVFSHNLVSNVLELNALNNESAIYEKFGITNYKDMIFTGSYFGSIYSIDISSEKCLETQITNDRACLEENKIRLIAYDKQGLFCVLGDSQLVKHRIDF